MVSHHPQLPLKKHDPNYSLTKSSTNFYSFIKHRGKKKITYFRWWTEGMLDCSSSLCSMAMLSSVSVKSFFLSNAYCQEDLRGSYNVNWKWQKTALNLHLKGKQAHTATILWDSCTELHWTDSLKQQGMRWPRPWQGPLVTYDAMWM